MANYRQTNHNGRVNAKTGKAYSRKHNNLQYDVTKAENINESMFIKNIILHYDKDNYKMSRPNVQKILYKNVQLVCLF